MKKSILIIMLFVVAFKINAQQLQSSAFYDMQSFIHNPSFVGTGTNDFVGVNYRTQWANINAGPKTATVYGSFALPKQKIGIGGYVYSDKTGPTSRTGLSLSVSKQITFSDNSKLSFGLENRFQQFLLDQTKLTEYLGADPAIGSANKSMKYDAGFGVSYTNKRLQLGVAVAQMLQSRLSNYTGTLNRSEEARLYRHFYATASYKIDLDETISMVPNAMFIYFPNAPSEFNFGTRFKYADVCWLGLGTSLTGNASFSFGLHVTKDITVDYAFDVYNNPADNFNYQAHEFMLRYSFKK